MSKDSSIRYVTAKMEDVAHNALLMRASEIGMHITALAAQYIMDGLVNDNQSNTFQMKLFKEVYAAKQRDMTRSQLEHVGFTALRDGDEAALKRLKELCKEAEMEYEDVIEMASRLHEAPSSSNDKMSQAMVFIMSVLRDGPVQATTAKEAGAERGFSEWMMNTAKGKLGVESYQEGGRWWWKIGDAEEGNVV